MTLLSRITGLVRESLKAVLFGAGVQMDAFEAAFRLPNILRRMFAEGAFSQAFVPILAEYHRQRGADATRELVGRVGTLLALALLVVTVIGMLAAPWLVYLLAAGFARTPGKVELTADLLRIVFPYILFVSLVSLAGGVLNVHRRFAMPAFTPVLLNLSIIGAAMFLAPHVDPPIMALAWGVALGGVAQLALQIRPLAKLGMLPRPPFDWRDEGVRRVLLAMGPAVLGVSAAQISALINTQLAAPARRRPHLVDHVRRPPDGVPERAARRRDRHRAAAVARAASQRRGRRPVLGAARLGPAPRVAARAAGRARAVAPRGPAHHDALPVRQVRRRRRVATCAPRCSATRRPRRRSSWSRSSRRASTRARTCGRR